jgi:hypothetical protein
MNTPIRMLISTFVLSALVSALPVAAEPTLDASLVDAEKLAAKAGATVEARVTGIELVDPASVQERPRAGQGHLHYRVDDGPVIATTVTKLSFHGLTPGEHRFEVSVVGNDHRPLGPAETLRVSVPLAAAHGTVP